MTNYTPADYKLHETETFAYARQRIEEHGWNTQMLERFLSIAHVNVPRDLYQLASKNNRKDSDALATAAD